MNLYAPNHTCYMCYLAVQLRGAQLLLYAHQKETRNACVCQSLQRDVSRATKNKIDKRAVWWIQDLLHWKHCVFECLFKCTVDLLILRMTARTASTMFNAMLRFFATAVWQWKDTIAKYELPFLGFRRNRALEMTALNAQPERHALSARMWTALASMFCSMVCLLNKAAHPRKWVTKNWRVISSF